MSKFPPTNRLNDCPVCGDISGDCRSSADDANYFQCLTNSGAGKFEIINGFKNIGLTKNGLWAQFVLEAGQAQTTYEERQQSRLDRETKERSLYQTGLSTGERHAAHGQLLAQLPLHDADRADLVRRGLSDEQIEAGQFRSIEAGQTLDLPINSKTPGVGFGGKKLLTRTRGYLVPARDTEGRILGFQIRNRTGDNPKYPWLSVSDVTPVNLQNGEMPLTVARGGNSSVLYLAEGVLKPAVAAAKHGITVVGASGGLFASSPKQLHQCVSALLPETLVLCPDAGAIANVHVMRQYAALNDELASMGRELKVLWYEQLTKADGDVDEISREQFEQADLISWAEFEAKTTSTSPRPNRQLELAQEQEAARRRAAVWVKAHKQASTELNRIADVLEGREAASDGLKSSEEKARSEAQIKRDELRLIHKSVLGSIRLRLERDRKQQGLTRKQYGTKAKLQTARAEMSPCLEARIAAININRDEAVQALKLACTGGSISTGLPPILIKERSGAELSVEVAGDCTTITVSGFFQLYQTVSQPEGGKERKLSPELGEIAMDGRTVYLCIPADSVQGKVTASRVIFGGLLEKNGCRVLVSTDGENLKAQSKRFSRWRKARMAELDRLKYPGLYGLTGSRTVNNDQYLSIGDLPPGCALFMSADCGRGKTTAMKNFLLSLFKANRDAQVEDIGYRISLGQQKVEIFNQAFASEQAASKQEMPLIVHLGDADTAEQYEAQVVSYPVDSLLRRLIGIRRALSDGRRVVVLFDETDAVMKHLFLGGTLKSRQAQAVQELRLLLPQVLASGGNIIGGEANLTQLSIDAITQLADAKPEQIIVVENTRKAIQRNVYSHSAVDENGKSSDNILRKMAAIDCMRALRGEDIRQAPLANEKIEKKADKKARILFCTTSQANAERVELMAREAGFTTDRHDGKTKNEAYSKAFRKNPDARLEAHKPDLTILTHSLESGVSIDIPDYFSAVLNDGDRLESRALLQFSMRARDPVDIHLYVNERALFAEFHQQTDPDEILKEFATYANDCRGFSGIDGVVKPEEAATTTTEDVNAAMMRAQYGAGRLLHTFRAKYEARMNQSSGNLREHALINFRNAGHIVTELPESAIEGVYDEKDVDSYKAANEAVTDGQTSFYLSQSGLLSPSQARKVLRSGKTTHAQRVDAIKSIDKANYPGLVIEDNDSQVAGFDCEAFVRREIIKGNRGLLKAHTLGWMQKNPAIAKQLDIKSWEKQCSAPFPVLPAIRNNSAKIGITGQAQGKTYNLAALVVEVAESGLNDANDEKVLLIAKIAIAHRNLLNRHLRIQITEKTSPEIIVNKLVRKFGFQPSRGSYQTTEQGSRRWVYKIKPRPHQKAVWDSLDRRWAKELSTQGIEDKPLQNRQEEKSLSENVTPLLRTPIPISQKVAVCATSPLDSSNLTARLAPDYYDSSAWG